VALPVFMDGISGVMWILVAILLGIPIAKGLL
jgi:hypothetical protein